MPRLAKRAGAMLPGELQRHLVRLGLTIEHAAEVAGVSYEHMRALVMGRSRIREHHATLFRCMTLTEASDLRIAIWQRQSFPAPRQRRYRHAAPAQVEGNRQ